MAFKSSVKTIAFFKNNKLPRLGRHLYIEPFAHIINEKSLHHHQKSGMKTLIDYVIANNYASKL